MSIGGHYLSFICIFTEVFFFTLPSSLFSDKQRSFQLEKNFTTSRGWNAWTVENTQRYKKEEERSIHISRGLKWSVWSSGSFFLYFFMFLTSCLRHESLDAHGLFLHRPFNKKKQKGTRGSLLPYYSCAVDTAGTQRPSQSPRGRPCCHLDVSDFWWEQKKMCHLFFVFLDIKKRISLQLIRRAKRGRWPPCVWVRARNDSWGSFGAAWEKGVSLDQLVPVTSSSFFQPPQEI